MRTGTYRDQSGRLATVYTTPTGYLIRYRNGRVVCIHSAPVQSARPDLP